MENIKKTSILESIDLTSLKPIKAILLFSIPILLATLFSSAFSLINAIVLKYTVGGDSVTAVNATSPISSLIFQFAYGCSSGFAIVASNKKGANDENGVKEALVHSIFLGVCLAILITTIGLLFYQQLINLLKIDIAYQEKAISYYKIILCGFIFTILNNVLGNFLRAIGNAFIPLLASITSTIVNILLAFALTANTLPFNLDTKGVAIATIIANLVSCLIMLIHIYKNIPSLRITKSDLKIDKQLIKLMLRLGVPLGFQWSILFIGSFVQSSKVNSFGYFATKAASCYSPFDGYLYIVFSVLSTTTLSFVGQNYGANKFKRIVSGVKAVVLIDFIFYALILIVTLPLVDKIPYIFLPANEVNDEVVFYCSTYLRLEIIFLIMQGIVMLSRVVLQGIRKTLVPFISGVGELLMRVLVCLLLPSIVDSANILSNKAYFAICFSTPLAWSISALIMGGSVIYIYFKSKGKINVSIE